MQQPRPGVRGVPPRLALEPAQELPPLDGRVARGGVSLLEGGQEGVGGPLDVGGVQRADDEGVEGDRFPAAAAAVGGGGRPRGDKRGAGRGGATPTSAERQGDDGAEGGVVEFQSP